MQYPDLTLNTNIVDVYGINKTGDLQNAYTPLQNLLTTETLGDFTTKNLQFDRHTPVDIIVTDEYDGSQNLIINDDVNQPKLINTRISIEENNTFRIPEHVGNAVTNVYDDSTLSKDVSLLKLYDNIPTLTFDGLLDGGSFKCGSYVFYFKLSDADGNLTNTIQESGIVQVHIGPINSTKVRMGLQDEISDKQVQFTLDGIDSGFDYVRVFYERISSDNSGGIAPLYYMVDQNFPITNGRAIITLSGEEQTLSISQTDLQNEFADIDAAKTQKVLHNILFVGNTQAYVQDYEALQRIAWKIIPKEVITEMQIGGVTGNYDLLATQGSRKGCYYNTLNTYYNTGYWPDEYYRFGIVFIYDNNLLSKVFNMQGVDFSLLSSTDDLEQIMIPKVFRSTDDTNAKDDPYTSEPEDFIFNHQYMTNSKGVIKFRKHQLIEGVEDVFTPKTLGIEFDMTNIWKGESDVNDWVQTLRKYRIKGFFFVRQKRIPSILAQGVVIGLTGKDNGSIPVIKNSSGTWCTYSFLGNDRLLHETGSEIEVTSEVVEKALLVPDFELRTATYNQIFTSQEFALSKVGHVDFLYSGTQAVPYKYEGYNDGNCLAKVTGVPQQSLTKTDGHNYFSTIAGVPEEPYKTENVNQVWNKTVPQDLTVSTSLIRGQWGSYVGISYGGYEYGDIINIKSDDFINNPNNNKIQFQKRFADSSFYSAISTRYNVGDDQKYITCYRGDCFPSMFTHRMMSNFIDPELPTNKKIIDPGCWAKNYAVRCTAEILDTPHSNLTSDSGGWYVKGPIDKKSSIISLVFGILTGNIGIAIRSIRELNTEHDSTPLQTDFANELAQAFEVFTGVDGKTETTPDYNESLYINIGMNTTNELYEIVEKGYIKKVNPSEQETGSSGILKSIFKSDDKWELHGLSQINRADVNAVSFGQWITFPVCSALNLAFRDVDFNNTTEEAKLNRKRSFYPLEEQDVKNNLLESQVINAACKRSISNSQIPGYKNVPYIKQEYFNRIYWSKPNITQQFINSYRMIYKDQYKEYNKEFGAITKLESLGDNLIVIFQHGIGLLPVDRSIKSQADATPYLASRDILPSQVQIITSDYGSMWKDSIISIPDAQVIFGVDTVARKIWKLSTNGIEFISDHIVTKFLNDYIDLSEYDFKEYQGHINVKTHYNAFKKDVIFTYYKDKWNEEEQKWEPGTTWSLCYNIATGRGMFTTFYDWYPVESCNVDNIFFSFDKEQIDAVYNQEEQKYQTDILYIEKETNRAVTNEEISIPKYKISKQVIDPQFTEKCNVFNCESGITVNFSELYQNGYNYYICWYEQISTDWQFKYEQNSSTIQFNTKIADLKVLYVPIEEEDFIRKELTAYGPDKMFNLRNSTPNRMLLWKHGQSGLYDNQGKIKPTHWYGKQHEFNFEFVVNENPVKQKIFNNLKLLANKAAPAKFEYEVVGEGYEWFEYKPIVEWINKKSIEDSSIDWWKCVLNRTSKDIVDGDANWAPCPDFPSLFDENKVIKKLPYLKMRHTDKKGTPERPHYKWDGGTTYWEQVVDKNNPNKDYEYTYNCSEPCLVEDDQLNEVRLRTESLGNDMKKHGRIRGNMQYLEDLWNVEIRPIQITWCYKENGELKFKKLPETRHRDKYIKVKVRYSGEDLALIQAIYTIFEESYA